MIPNILEILEKFVSAIHQRNENGPSYIKIELSPYGLRLRGQRRYPNHGVVEYERIISWLVLREADDARIVLNRALDEVYTGIARVPEKAS